MTQLVSPTHRKLEIAQDHRFRLKRVLSIVCAHLVQDTYAAFLAPLLPSLIEKLSLSYTQAGSLSAISQLPSLLNPLIGYLDDKINLRHLVILAPAISATTLSCLGLPPSYLSLLIVLFITGLSIASFHAISPAMVARESGDQIGKGMSLFMAAGEMGRTIGPLIAAWALLTFTLRGMFPIAIPGWIASLIIFFRLKDLPVHIQKENGFREVLPAARRLFLPLFGITFFRSFLITGLGVYLPTLLQSHGATVWKADATLAIYQFAGVVGAFLGGTVSDRLGRKPVLLTVSTFAPLTVLFFLKSTGLMVPVILVFSGLLGLSSQPILLAIVQDHLPGHRSIGNGTFMACSFISLSTAAVLIGALADRIGLDQAIRLSAISGLAVVPLIFFLPSSPLQASPLAPSQPDA